jgi:hypothetical protein
MNQFELMVLALAAMLPLSSAAVRCCRALLT